MDRTNAASPGSVPVPAHRRRRMDEPPSVADDRVPTGGEPCAARATGRPPLATERRPAPPPRSPGQGVGTEDPRRTVRHRHARDSVGVASKTDLREVIFAPVLEVE